MDLLRSHSFYAGLFAVLGLFVTGCDLLGQNSDSTPEYVGSWIDTDVQFEGETKTGDFYLVFSEDRMTEWRVVGPGGDDTCRSDGADIIQYKPSSHRMVVAPDSGTARKKVYVEPLGDQIVVSEQYIFYILGYSDTLRAAEKKPSTFPNCP